MASDLGVVIPAFHPDLERLRAYVHAIDQQLSPQTIRIELDAPSDGVPERLAELPAVVRSVDRRYGKGAAVTAGFEALETDVRAFVDADGSTSVDSLAEVVRPVQTGQAELAVGSRRHPESRVIADQSVFRRYLGAGFVRLAQTLLSVSLSDYQCGTKAISATAWQRVRDQLYESGFAWDIELIAVAAALDQRIVEVPIEWVNYPSVTVSPIADTVRMFRGLLRARYRATLAPRDRLRSLLGRLDRRPPLVDRVRDESPPSIG